RSARFLTMPRLDISRSSFRALVKAAHQRRMSVDSFIRDWMAQKADSSGANDVTNAGEVAADAQSASPTGANTDSADRSAVGAGVGVAHNGSEVGHHAAADSTFEVLWARIEQNAGREISTKRGRGFTYEIEAGYLTVHESGTRVPRSQFRTAWGQWPARGPSAMRGVYAASVVWAVLAGVDAGRR
ncbi:MAG: hypothetical protein O6922_04020, partial [Chloroflexi bacterium]|nr:hypothetical protein [Chloroflexota bacterium]